jgi:hypothetical protein
MHKDLEQHRSGERGEGRGEAVSAVRVLPRQLLLRQFTVFFVDAHFYILSVGFRPLLVDVIVLCW